MGALFLSLRYHSLFPGYIGPRLSALAAALPPQALRVLIVVLDAHSGSAGPGPETEEPLKSLAKSCIGSGITLLLAWSDQEAATVLETLKGLESKPPDIIRESFPQATAADAYFHKA